MTTSTVGNRTGKGGNGEKMISISQTFICNAKGNNIAHVTSPITAHPDYWIVPALKSVEIIMGMGVIVANVCSPTSVPFASKRVMLGGPIATNRDMHLRPNPSTGWHRDA
jgi:hypothetical protein